MLGDPIGGTDDGIAWIAGCPGVCACGEFLDGGIDELVTHQILLNGTLKGLIVLRERSVSTARSEHVSKAFGFHDEGVFGLRVQLAVGGKHGRPATIRHIAYPFFAGPGDHRMPWIPWFAVTIHRSTVVNNSPVYRPAPRPLGVQADTGLINVVAASGHVAFLGIALTIEPVPR